MNVEQVIKTRGPILRADIAKETGLDERTVRAEIVRLQESGVPVVFRPDQGGFVYAKSRGQINDWANNQMAAARSIIRKVAAVRKTDIEGIVRELI